MTLLFIYCAVGVACALAAAVYEYNDGALPGDVGSAGAVGLFVLLFWPIVALVMLLGVAAFNLAKFVRAFSGKEPR